MDVKEAIRKRRAYRSLEGAKIDNALVRDLAGSARLAPSCFNNQPWRFVFAHEPEVLQGLYSALSEGNRWAFRASMIVAVCARKQDDCIINEREYYLFDAGIATAFLVLRATELGLVAHAIAGYSPKKVRQILKIPDEYNVITLVIVGGHSSKINPELSEKQAREEVKRPRRLPLKELAYVNEFKEKN